LTNFDRLLAAAVFPKVYGKNPKMNAFNKEYFFVLKPDDDERIPYLTPDRDTVKKQTIKYKKQNGGYTLEAGK
jgi:hypothetical protein